MKDRQVEKRLFAVLAMVFGAVVVGSGGWWTYQRIRVRRFLPVEGVVAHAKVGHERVEYRTIYYPDIRFRYVVNGQQYDDGRYRILVRSSSGRSGKREIVKQYPVGSRVTGYYDPADPSIAVIDRSFGDFFPPLLVVNGFVVLIGCMGLLFYRGEDSAAPGRPDEHGLFPIGHRREDVPLERFSGLGSRPASLAPIIGVTVLCNAMAFGLVFSIWFLPADDQPPFWAKCFVVVFTVCFMGFSLVLLFLTAKMVLPRLKLAAPTIIASAQPLRIGERFDIAFEQRAKSRVDVERVILKLICREIATGLTPNKADSHDIYTDETEFAWHAAGDRARPITGRMQFRIPDDAMHSFTGVQNRIAWLIEVRTATAGWPEYSDSFDLQVAPARATE